MGIETTIAIIASAAIAAGGTAISANQSKKQAEGARNAQKEAQTMDMAVAGEEAARDRRQAIREARLRRAGVENMAATQGQSASSGVIAGGQNSTAVAGTTSGYLANDLSGANVRGIAHQNVYDAQNSQGNLFATVGAGLMQSVGGMGMSMAGGAVADDIFAQGATAAQQQPAAPSPQQPPAKYMPSARSW